jgi:hypothetical protein
MATQSTNVNVPNSPQTTNKVDLKTETAQFLALKKSLNQIDSWELAGSSWDDGLNMKFAQPLSVEVARVLLRVIG